MNGYSLLAMTTITSLWMTAQAGASIWINEFHYDNVGADAGEFVEIVVGPDMSSVDLSDVRLTLYNGAGGASYDQETLDQFNVGDLVNGFQFYWLAIDPIQNGDPDGLALDENGTVIEFISYGGTFTATNGPALGQTSTGIGVAESGSTPVGASLGRSGGPGSTGSDFSWIVMSDDSPGQINSGQTLVQPSSVVPEPYSFLVWTTIFGLVALTSSYRTSLSG